MSWQYYMTCRQIAKLFALSNRGHTLRDDTSETWSGNGAVQTVYVVCAEEKEDKEKTGWIRMNGQQGLETKHTFYCLFNITRLYHKNAVGAVILKLWHIQ